MGNKGLLSTFLDARDEQSTIIGKVFLKHLVVLRILLLLGMWIMWEDEKFDFTCYTEERMCKVFCSKNLDPKLLTFFWRYQVICVSIPILHNLLYMVHINLRTQKKKQDEKQLKGDSGRGQDGARVQDKDCDVPISRGGLLSYVISIVLSVLFEVGLLTYQYNMYGFRLKQQYRCDDPSCSRSVDCILHQSREKNLVLILLLAMACLSLVLNVLELCVLCRNKLQQGMTIHVSPDTFDSKVFATNPEAVSLLPSHWWCHPASPAHGEQSHDSFHSVRSIS